MCVFEREKEREIRDEWNEKGVQQNVIVWAIPMLTVTSAIHRASVSSSKTESARILGTPSA